MGDFKFENIQYLSFEGGGGKGLVYLGATKALEDRLKKERIIDINEELYERKIRGISGGPAGAITAFMIALGMSSSEMVKEFNRTNELMSIGYGIFSQNTPEKVSPFEKFFEDYIVDNDKKNDPNIKCHKKYRIRSRVFNYRTRKVEKYFCHKNSTFMESIVQDFVYNFLTSTKGQIIRGLVEKSNDLLLRRIFDIPWVSLTEKQKVTIPSTYIYNLLFNRGLFPGFEVRRYFSSMIDIYLKPKLVGVDTNSEDITFKQFFQYTGVDLVITGTNTTTHRPKYFSVFHTPDFSVVDAVSISMNLPFIFKPFYIKSNVHRGKGRKYNEEYHGFWVDGGMLNNYPIHAFDSLSTVDKLRHHNSYYPSYKVASGNDKISDFKSNVLGFRLVEREEFENLGSLELNRLESDIKRFYERGIKPYIDYLTDQDLGPFAILASAKFAGNLLGTFMYPGSDGQIRTETEEKHTIELNSLGLGVTDFASPSINELRGQKEISDLKKNLIMYAEKLTKKRLS